MPTRRTMPGRFWPTPGVSIPALRDERRDRAGPASRTTTLRPGRLRSTCSAAERPPARCQLPPRPVIEPPGYGGSSTSIDSRQNDSQFTSDSRSRDHCWFTRGDRRPNAWSAFTPSARSDVPRRGTSSSPSSRPRYASTISASARRGWRPRRADVRTDGSAHPREVRDVEGMAASPPHGAARRYRDSAASSGGELFGRPASRGLVHQPLRRLHREAAPGAPDRIERQRRVADDGDAQPRRRAAAGSASQHAPHLADTGGAATARRPRERFPESQEVALQVRP